MRNESSISKCVESALSSVRDAASIDGSITLVVDPQLADPLGESAEVREALERRLLRRVSVPRIHDDIDPARAPYLLHSADELAIERVVNASINIAVRELHRLLGEQYRARSVCAWICGEPDPLAVARRLSNCARIRRPNGDSWVLRVWDPRVIAHLPRVLAPSQWKAVTGISDTWYTFGIDAAFADAMTTLKGSDLPPAPHPFQLDTRTWVALERIGPINQIISLAEEWGLPVGTALMQKVDGLVKKCVELGFEAEQDLLVFAACALTSHECFDEHPLVQSALNLARRERQSLAEAVGLLPEQLWDELRSSDWARQQQRITTGI